MFPFKFIISTVMYIIVISKIPVAILQVKKLIASCKKSFPLKDLLSKTQSLLVKKAKITANIHAIAVDVTFENSKIL